MGSGQIKLKVKTFIEDDQYDPSSISIPDDKFVSSLVCTDCSNIKLEYILTSKNNSDIIEKCNECNQKTLHKYIIHESV